MGCLEIYALGTSDTVDEYKDDPKPGQKNYGYRIRAIRVRAIKINPSPSH